MAITLTVKEETKKRLDRFKTCEMTDDDLLNYLMNTVSTEDITEDDVRKHYERLETFKLAPKDDFIKMTKISPKKEKGYD